MKKIFCVVMFLSVCFFTQNEIQSGQKKDGIYAFQVTEIKHANTVKFAKVIWQGKPIVLNKTYYTRTDELKFKIQWTENKERFESEIEVDLYDDGSITLFDFNIASPKY